METYYKEFYKKVIALLNILTSNLPSCYQGYDLTYQFKEYDPEYPLNNGWKIFKQTVHCDNFHLEIIRTDEESYKQETYNWQPEILKIEERTDVY